MKKSKAKYYYLVERKRDGERFCMFGNLKLAWLGVSHLFQFVPESYGYAISSPFGLIHNVASDLKYNSRDYRVIYQVAR